MDALYTTAATARGGRAGEVVSEDGVLDVELALPKELGGPGGDRSNPEQLFAAGYAACFHSAVLHVAGRRKVDATSSEITARVSIGTDGGFSQLAVTLLGSFPALDVTTAQELMDAAHQMCPYSRATRGNIRVDLEVA